MNGINPKKKKKNERKKIKRDTELQQHVGTLQVVPDVVINVIPASRGLRIKQNRFRYTFCHDKIRFRRN